MCAVWVQETLVHVLHSVKGVLSLWQLGQKDVHYTGIERHGCSLASDWRDVQLYGQTGYCSGIDSFIYKHRWLNVAAVFARYFDELA